MAINNSLMSSHPPRAHDSIIARPSSERTSSASRGDISFTSAVDGKTNLFEKSTLAFEPGVTEEGDALLVS